MTKSLNDDSKENEISTQKSQKSSSIGSAESCDVKDTDKVLLSEKDEFDTENSEQKTLLGRLEIDDGDSLEQLELEDGESPAIGVAYEMDPELKGLMDEFEVNDDDFDPEKSGNVASQRRDTEQIQTLTERNPRICAMPYRIGRCIVIFPYLYKKTGYGIVGAHFCPGVLVTVLLLSSLSYFFIQLAYKIGSISFFISCIFALVSHISLIFVCFTDPGIINPKGCRKECMKFCTLSPNTQNVNGKTQTYRYCGFCK